MKQLESSSFERDEIFEFENTWQGIDVTIKYCPRWLCSDEDTMITQHIEIYSAERIALPITETGYKSLFMNGTDALADYDNDPVAFVLAWMDGATKSKAWLDHVERSRQPDLFG